MPWREREFGDGPISGDIPWWLNAEPEPVPESRPWTDPDNPPSPPGHGWLYNPHQQPTQNPGPGNYWSWNGTQWEPRPVPRASPPPSAPTGNLGEPPPGGGDIGGYDVPGGGGFGYLTEPFTGRPPSWMAGPTFRPPTFERPPAFAYEKFQAPTADSIYADPSYQFRTGEGRRALEQSAAGRGVLRTGGTLKDLINFGQNAASQEYSNIFDRGVTAHNLGLQQALGSYATNYGVDRDVYDRLYEGNKATFEGQQRENELINQREFNNFLADFDIFEKSRRRAGDYLFQGAGLGG